MLRKNVTKPVSYTTQAATNLAFLRFKGLILQSLILIQKFRVAFATWGWKSAQPNVTLC